ncbi:unnamed protein product [Gadus morhua 'NCC']
MGFILFILDMFSNVAPSHTILPPSAGRKVHGALQQRRFSVCGALVWPLQGTLLRQGEMESSGAVPGPPAGGWACMLMLRWVEGTCVFTGLSATQAGPPTDREPTPGSLVVAC